MKLLRYTKNLIRFIQKGGIRTGGITYSNIYQVQSGESLMQKNIFITGGSSGIGFAIAEKCIKEGAKVIITGKSKEKLEKAQNELGKEKCEIIEFDITNAEEYDKAIEEIRECFNNKIDCLVNNAGIYINSNYSSCTESEYDNIFNVNMRGVYFFTQKLLENFESITNILMISSETGLEANDGPYGLSKATLINYTKGLAKRLYKEGKNIRVNAIAPGVTISNISPDNSSYSKEGNLYRDGLLGKRVLLPEEIAEVASFLLSDISKCINGQVIACNEGNTI